MDAPQTRDPVGNSPRKRGQGVPTINPYLFFGGLAGFLTIGVAGLSNVYFELSLLASWFVGITTAALFIMALDKSIARGGRSANMGLRAPEAVVFVAGLLGGAPGILLGMHLFRHKTKKAAFQFVLGVIFLMQIVVLFGNQWGE